MYIISQDTSYKKSSLFHRIVGPFAFRVDNPKIVTFKFDKSKEDPFGRYKFNKISKLRY